MDGFSVKPKTLETEASQIKKIQAELKLAEAKIAAVKLGLTWNVKYKANINNSLGTLRKNTSQLASSSGKFSSKLGQCARTYSSTESSILSYGKVDKKRFKLPFSAGIFGDFVSGIIGITNAIVTGRWDKVSKSAYGMAKWAKGLIDTSKKMGKAKRMLHPDTYRASWFKRLFGFRDYFADLRKSVASTFGKRVHTNFNKAISKEFSKISWIGVALSGIVNSVDNYFEYKTGSIDAGRALKETLLETGIDVGKNALLAAGVAAVLAATPIGAPAIAVAAGVWAISSGADLIVKWATGGEKSGFTEWLSDGILDIGEHLFDSSGRGLMSWARSLGFS